MVRLFWTDGIWLMLQYKERLNLQGKVGVGEAFMDIRHLVDATVYKELLVWERLNL